MPENQTQKAAENVDSETQSNQENSKVSSKGFGKLKAIFKNKKLVGVIGGVVLIVMILGSTLVYQFFLGKSSKTQLSNPVSTSLISSQPLTNNLTSKSLQNGFRSENKDQKKEDEIGIEDAVKNFNKINTASKPFILADKNLINQEAVPLIPKIYQKPITDDEYFYFTEPKPIYIKQESTVYFPYSSGYVAKVNIDTGEVKWDKLGFKISQMSLFDGNYYFTVFEDGCSGFFGSESDTSQNRKCTLIAVDRKNLDNKKILLENIYIDQRVVFANNNEFWLAYDKGVVDGNYEFYEKYDLSGSFQDGYLLQARFGGKISGSVFLYKLKETHTNSPEANIKKQKIDSADYNCPVTHNCPEAGDFKAGYDRVCKNLIDSLGFINQNGSCFEMSNPISDCGNFKYSTTNGLQYKNVEYNPNESYETIACVG